MGAEGHIYIGTSGWHYSHWRGVFYPDTLLANQWLRYYIDHFGTVEINNSFYQLPDEATFEQWRNTVPTGFVFAVKASRYLTHMKKLKDAHEPLARFLERVNLLKDRTGPLLFQLPPRWRADVARLRAFLEAVPANHRCAFEFRDPTWFHPDVYEILAEHHAAFCIYDLAGQTSPREVTADFVYVRLHGPGAAYEGSYTPRHLAGWAGAFSTWRREGRDVYCYFDNDQHGYAVANAMRLQDMMR